jgi:hypothetical protein
MIYTCHFSPVDDKSDMLTLHFRLWLIVDFPSPSTIVLHRLACITIASSSPFSPLPLIIITIVSRQILPVIRLTALFDSTASNCIFDPLQSSTFIDLIINCSYIPFHTEHALNNHSNTSAWTWLRPVYHVTFRYTWQLLHVITNVIPIQITTITTCCNKSGNIKFVSGYPRSFLQVHVSP